MVHHAFRCATEPQILGWPEIRAGRDVLISAPTGSGKTLAAFLLCLDRLVRQARTGELPNETEVVYVSPLKALSNDIRKNLEIPLTEISELAARRGIPLAPIRTAVRTGDTPAWERQQMGKQRPHILVTTPESLYILLTAEKSRAMLRTTRTVIVDEIHAVADDKRGSHLALSLARLGRPYRRSRTPAAAHRPVGHGEADRRSRAIPEPPRPHRQHRPSPRNGAGRRSPARRAGPGRHERDVGRNLRPCRRS